jgi:putative DNA primase/helicase
MTSGLRAAARRLGGEVSGRAILCPGPGHSAQDRSLSVWLGPSLPNGFAVKSHCGDDFRDCRDLVAEKLGLPAFERGRQQAERPTAARAMRRKGREAPSTTLPSMMFWNGALDPRGTPAQRYFERDRKLELPAELCGEVFRWHPDAGAIFALFRSIESNTPQAISRIFLDADGHKIDRRFLGPVQGAAIILDPWDEVSTGLHIAEGVETGMAARQLGLRPVWSLGSAPLIAAFPVLGGVECLTLLAESDAASGRACAECADRWRSAGREVIIKPPPAPFKDWNDFVIARANA